MKKLIAVMACVVMVDDEQEEVGQGLPRRNPLDDLVERMRREMQHGRDTVQWRDADGQKVA